MFWTSKKIRIVCAAVLFILGTHIFLTYAMDAQNTSLLKRGDFSSFYAAGMMVRQHYGAQLYDTRVLAYVQNLYWPSLNGNYISFPYPPFVALALAPFAYLPPQPSKIIFTLLMMFVTAMALRRMSRLAPVLKNPLAVCAFLLAFYPISFGVFGSQFTALNMFLYAAVLEAWSRGTREGDTLTGIFLGLWCFKPQYAAVLIFFFMAARSWKIVRTALTVALFYYVCGALLQGLAWPLSWLQAAGKAAAIDFPHNDFNMISFAGFFHAAGRISGLGESQAWVLNAAAWGLSALLLSGVGLKFWKAGNLPDGDEKRSQILYLLTLAAPVMLLASPHALFYDLGICVIACAPYLKMKTDRAVWSVVALTAAAFLLTMFKFYLPLQPMIFYVAGAFVFITKSANRGCGTPEIQGK